MGSSLNTHISLADTMLLTIDYLLPDPQRAVQRMTNPQEYKFVWGASCFSERFLFEDTCADRAWKAPPHIRKGNTKFGTLERMVTATKTVYSHS